ncbi:SigE family RNA polymerase sigma factor [Solihabitans fulvus]|uniref:SigE family RNA polymerase sigma factor n=1 Tax=Solihabitans fulvus TaxID=1892852 RepID=UPI001CB765F6|nr:SigE family RNA polymerase sigma factor [Solihabitans fulvus]
MSPRNSSDDDEFRRFATAAIAPLGRLAHALCGDRHLAEDLVQTCLIKVHLAWPRIRHPESVDAYVRKVLLRCWLNEQRRPWRRSENRNGELPDAADESADPGRRMGSHDTRELLRLALAEVPPRQRAAVVLRYWSQLSVTETAAAMRCSEGTVKSQAARGVEALRAALQRRGVDDSHAALRSY